MVRGAGKLAQPLLGSGTLLLNVCYQQQDLNQRDHRSCRGGLSRSGPFLRHCHREAWKEGGGELQRRREMQSQALVPALPRLRSPQCSLLGWPVRSGEASRLPACAWLGALCLQGGRVASSAQGWAGPHAAKTCLSSCLFFFYYLFIIFFPPLQSTPGLLSLRLCLSSPVGCRFRGE